MEWGREPRGAGTGGLGRKVREAKFHRPSGPICPSRPQPGSDLGLGSGVLLDGLSEWEREGEGCPLSSPQPILNLLWGERVRVAVLALEAFHRRSRGHSFIDEGAERCGLGSPGKTLLELLLQTLSPVPSPTRGAFPTSCFAAFCLFIPRIYTKTPSESPAVGWAL